MMINTRIVQFQGASERDRPVSWEIGAVSTKRTDRETRQSPKPAMPKLGASGARAVAFRASDGSTATPDKVMKNALSDMVQEFSGQFTPEKLAELPEKRERKTVLPPKEPKPPKKKKEKKVKEDGEGAKEGEEGTSEGAAQGSSSVPESDEVEVVSGSPSGGGPIEIDDDDDVQMISPGPSDASTPIKRTAEEAELEAQVVETPASKKGKGKEKASEPTPKKSSSKKQKKEPAGGHVLGGPELKAEESVGEGSSSLKQAAEAEQEEEEELAPLEGPLEPHFPPETIEVFNRQPKEFTERPMSLETADLVLENLPFPKSIPYGHQDAATLHTVVLDMNRRGHAVLLADQQFYLFFLLSARNVVNRIARSLRRARDGFLGDYVDDLIVGPGKAPTFFEDLDVIQKVFSGTAGRKGGAAAADDGSFRLWEDENDLGADIRAVLVAIDEMGAEGASGSGSGGEDDEDDEQDGDYVMA